MLIGCCHHLDPPVPGTLAFADEQDAPDDCRGGHPVHDLGP